MTWFYVSNGQQAGPVDDAQLADLARSGAVQPDTLVWREGLANWQPYRTVVPAPDPPPVAMAPAIPAGMRACSQCGLVFPDSQLVAVGGALTCANCKTVVLQRLQQGTLTPGNRRYAGFWIRFGALFVDGLILGTAFVVLVVVAAIPFGASIALGGQDELSPLAAVGIGIAYLASFAGSIAYQVYFLTQKGATPGKMVFGLEVIRSDGGRLSVGRAVARFFAHALSGMVLYIGYIIAAFDSEKRALHDHICDTRVVYKN